MKKVLCVIMLAGLMSSQALASGLGIFGSYWDSKDAGDTYGGGALLRLPVNPTTSQDIRGSYFEFTERFEGMRTDWEIIPVEAALLIHLVTNPGFTLYAGGGGGYYFADATIRGVDGNDRMDIDNEFGYFALAGLRLRLSPNMSLFAEAQYRWIDFDQAKFRGDDEKFDIDLKMDGFGANAGLLLRF